VKSSNLKQRLIQKHLKNVK